MRRVRRKIHRRILRWAMSRITIDEAIRSTVRYCKPDPDFGPSAAITGTFVGGLTVSCSCCDGGSDV